MKRLFPILVIITLLACITAVSATGDTNMTTTSSNDNSIIENTNTVSTSDTNNVITETVDKSKLTGTTTSTNFGRSNENTESSNITTSDKNTDNSSGTANHITKTTSTSNKTNITSKTLKSANSMKVVYVSTHGKDSNAGTSSSPKLTIQNALTLVANGGTIHVNSGTYYQKGIYINKDVTISGTSTKSTTINGQNSHVFTIAKGANVIIKNLRVTNAYDKTGGAIYNKGTLTLKNMKIDSSHASGYGGAIYNKGHLSVTKSSFTNNYANYGGAIYNDGTLSISRSTFNKNNARILGSAMATSSKMSINANNFTYNNHTAIYIASKSKTTIKASRFLYNIGVNGGSIYNNGNLFVNKTYFKSNQATYYGGAIYNKKTLTSRGSTYTDNTARYGGALYNKKSLYINSNSFKNNKARINGGAVYNTAALTIKASQFKKNNANTYGGAVYNQMEKAYNTKIVSSTFEANHARQGGAIANAGSKLKINKVTFNTNTATKYGGAVYNIKSTTTITNSILLKNNKIDIYRVHGTVTANYNWWGSNIKPSNTRQHDSTVNYWVYLRITTKTSTIINNLLTTTVNINNIYNGKTISSYKTSTHLPTISVKVTVNGCGINKAYKFTNGTYTIKTKFTKIGQASITAYTYNQKVKTKITVKNSNTRLTSLFVQLQSTVTKSTVNNWVKAGITDVYVQARASTNNYALLKKVISLSSGTSIRVHAWVICFTTDNGFNIGTSQQNMIRNFVSKVVKINGISGVCLDYVRYDGTNPKIVKTSVITNFVKSVNKIVKGQNKNLQLSACLFAEGSGTARYYGQDYAALSPYLDVELLMAYKYDYSAGRSWLKSVTSYAVNQAKYSKVVTILQTYNLAQNPLSSTELLNDAKAVISAGSSGYGLFRYGLISRYPTSAEKIRV